MTIPGCIRPSFPLSSEGFANPGLPQETPSPAQSDCPLNGSNVLRGSAIPDLIPKNPDPTHCARSQPVYTEPVAKKRPA